MTRVLWRSLGVIGIGLLAFISESDARELRLADAIRLVTAHAPQLTSSNAAVSAAEAGKRAASAERLGTLSLTASANYISELSSLNIAFPNLPPINRELGTHESYQADLRYSLPIWTGGRLGSTIKLASLNESIAAAVASADTLRIVYQAHLEYFNLVAATEGVRIADVTLARVQNLQKEVRDLRAAGVADSLALIEADLAVNRAKLAQEQANDTRRRAELRLLQLCGLPIQETLTVVDSFVAPVPLSSGSDSMLRPELTAALRRISLSDARTRQQRAEYLPTLGAYAGYSYGKPNLDRFGNSWNDYWSAGAQLQWSFNFGGKTSSSVERNQFERQAAVSEFDRIREQLTTDQLLARERANLALAMYQTQKERFELRTTAFRLSQIQFREGILSATRLFDTEQLLGEAELSAAVTLIDWYAARSAYWYTVGAPELAHGQ